MISTKPRGPSIWAHAVVSTQVALHRPGLPYQHDEHELATIRSAAAEFLRLRGRTSESQMPSGTVKRASSSSFRRCARRRQTCRESGLDQRAGLAPWLAHIICRHRFIILGRNNNNSGREANFRLLNQNKFIFATVDAFSTAESFAKFNLSRPIMLQLCDVARGLLFGASQLLISKLPPGGGGGGGG